MVLASFINGRESGGSVRILLVDDHTIVRSGLRRLLAALPEVQISEAATGQEALTLTRAEQPTLTVLDLNLPGLGGLELLRRLLVEHPDGRVVCIEHACSVALRRSSAARGGCRLSQQECLA